MRPIIDIPDDLKELDQWVLWRYEGPDATKIPVQANGTKASTADYASWATYVDIHATYLDGGYDGIGFVFTADDPFVGIDLDDCLDEKGDLKPWAQPIVQAFADTYMEVSPSESGIKLFTRGAIKQAHKFAYDNGAIESGCQRQVLHCYRQGLERRSASS